MKETEMTLWQFLDLLDKDNRFLNIFFGSRAIKACYIGVAFFFGVLIGLREAGLMDIIAFGAVFLCAWFLDTIVVVVKTDE